MFITWLLCLLSTALGSFNDYQVLGIQPGAGLDQVKAAYRQEALRWHPDKNDDPEATVRFREITDAYTNLKAVLSNESKNPSPDPFKVFNDFMSAGFSFSFSSGGARVSGTSQSSSTVIQNGKKVTKTIVKDLGSGKTETTITEEDLSTGSKNVRKLYDFDSKHNSIEL